MKGRGASTRRSRKSSLVRDSVELREGRLRWVVVADTHGRPHPDTLARVTAEKPDHILHAGDIGDLGVLDQLRKIAPVLAVRGNIDAPSSDVPDALVIDVLDHGRPRTRILLVHYGVIGPKLRGDVALVARHEGALLVVCGHSHVPFIGTDGGIGVFNPGSVGPRRFNLPIVYGVIQIERQGIRLHHVSCETGEPWTP
jgi:putative phosphoesterase